MRPIRSAVDAERAALEALVARGFGDARLTAGGPDQGVDVVATGLVGQVKAQVSPVGAPIVQQIAGIAAVEQAVAVAFGLGGFTSAAKAFADRANVGLFGFNLEGQVIPLNASARSLAEARPRPGFRHEWSRETPGTIDQYLAGVLGIAVRGDGFTAAWRRRDGSLLFETDIWTELISIIPTAFVVARRIDPSHNTMGSILLFGRHGERRSEFPLPGPSEKVVFADEDSILAIHGNWESASRLARIRLEDGKVLWELELPDRPQSHSYVTKGDVDMAVSDDSIYIEVNNRTELRLLCVGLTSGATKWDVPLPVPLSEVPYSGRPPLLLEGGVVPGSGWTGPGWLRCFYQRTGELMWTSEKLIPSPDEMLLVDGVVVIRSDEDNSLRGIDGATGRALWRTRHPIVDRAVDGYTPPGWLYAVGKRLVIDSPDGRASQVIDAKSGQNIGEWRHGRFMTLPPSVRRKRVLFVNGPYLIVGAPSGAARQLLFRGSSGLG